MNKTAVIDACSALMVNPRCDVSIGCSTGQVWETGVTTLQQLRGILPDEQP
jgi:hypothetical protein